MGNYLAVKRNNCAPFTGVGHPFSGERGGVSLRTVPCQSTPDCVKAVRRWQIATRRCINPQAFGDSRRPAHLIEFWFYHSWL